MYLRKDFKHIIISENYDLYDLLEKTNLNH